jgi:hypothetical protein
MSDRLDARIHAQLNGDERGQSQSGMATSAFTGAAATVYRMALRDVMTVHVPERDYPGDEYADIVCAHCREDGPSPFHRSVGYPCETVVAIARALHVELDAQDRWDNDVPPGGNVCAVCGTPTETEPCREHQPQAWEAMQR